MTPVVLGDGAAPVEWAGEGGFTLHAAPIGHTINDNATSIPRTFNTNGLTLSDAYMFNPFRTEHQLQTELKQAVKSKRMLHKI